MDIERAEQVNDICDGIAGLVEDCDDVVIGAALSEAVACFIASQSPGLREPALELFISTVRTSWPAIAEELVDGEKRGRAR